MWITITWTICRKTLFVFYEDRKSCRLWMKFGLECNGGNVILQTSRRVTSECGLCCIQSEADGFVAPDESHESDVSLWDCVDTTQPACFLVEISFLAANTACCFGVPGEPFKAWSYAPLKARQICISANGFLHNDDKEAAESRETEAGERKPGMFRDAGRPAPFLVSERMALSLSLTGKRDVWLKPETINNTAVSAGNHICGS